MRITGLILGIIGGIVELISAVLVLLFGGYGSVLGAKGTSTVIWGGFAAISLSLLGLVWGALAISKPKVAGALMNGPQSGLPRPMEFPSLPLRGFSTRILSMRWLGSRFNLVRPNLGFKLETQEPPGRFDF